MVDKKDTWQQAAEIGAGCILGGTLTTGIVSGASFFVPPLASQIPNAAALGCASGAWIAHKIPTTEELIAASFQKELEKYPSPTTAPGALPSPTTPPTKGTPVASAEKPDRNR